MERQPNRLRRMGMATVLALTGAAAGPVAEIAQGSGSCVSNTHFLEGGIEAGHARTFKAKKAIVYGDVFLGKNDKGRKLHDNVAETGALVRLVSRDCETWTIFAPYGAAVELVRGSASAKEFNAEKGQAFETMMKDHRSTPGFSVDFQGVKK